MRRVEFRRLVRFALTGVVATAVHIATAMTLLGTTTASPPLANGVAFAAATACSYIINTLWSFSSPMRGQSFVRFIGVSLLGCGIAVAVSGAAHAAGLSPLTGIAYVVLTVPPVTFVLHSAWTYR